jgi:hypothetical protein
MWSPSVRQVSVVGQVRTVSTTASVHINASFA